ncbi:putative bifunctional diguanylate cyclase/phosphodiesterase [Kangiella koreensis]|uniref:Diguanylate cyclase/phosphodiesterase with PAS/PAC sensor(S) n=1 Tax=Kangiella koreensis (strain DSM 16069 / JCM 12317 / KCTC 12182 / SW-125) TaxID=523791 RepID=C7RC12_KANKD|nr:bifunctional diguanylate cyclase/phosphodiesterase [Kangiella koreensis]ACV26804.1 diguanylate cyclase/phosphodiesterase with PAS/PAC sensor(s) [Kangiella koreensis DSM 16069]
MHKLLNRQIQHYLNGDHNLLPKSFLKAIDEAYNRAEEERLWYERSLSLNSGESRQRFNQLQSKLTELEEVKSELEQSIRKLRVTMDAGYDGIVQVNSDGIPTAYNDTVLKMLNLTARELQSLSYRKICQHLFKNIKNPEVVINQLRKALMKQDDSGNILVEHNDGRFFECKAKALELDGQTQGLVWTIKDITDLKLKEREARYLAYHDELTNLPNRTLFFERLEHALDLAKRKEELLAVIFLDLDEFKTVNDTFGHAQGDLLLQKVAKRILVALREHDTFARLGGDEFVIMLEDVEDREAIVNVLDRVKHALDTPITLGTNQVYITPSLGVAIYPEDGDDAQDLLKKADMAMYNSKKHGKNTYSFYSNHLEQYSTYRLSMRTALRRALRNSEFFLEYQPKFSLSDKRMMGVEALIRWNNKETLMSPNEFLNEAESNGMIIPISQWVIEQACRDIAHWKGDSKACCPVSINISPRYFQHGCLVDDLKACVNRFKIDASCIEIEITEQAFIPDIENAIKRMHELNDIGVKISIDDFGTGYSSFNYLMKLPVQQLKIDTSFIRSLEESEIQHSLVAEIIKIAHLFGLSVVAEGVEHEHIADLLMSYDCDLAQGFWLGSPIPANQFYKQFLVA